MRCWIGASVIAASLCLITAAPFPATAQSRAQLGPLCTSEHTPADKQIAACNKILALKVFSGPQLATIYFWRAVGWNKKGDYARVIADTTEALRIAPRRIEPLNLRGSAWYDKGEYDIAIADFTDAIRIGPPSGTIFHNRGNAWRNKRDYVKAIADYDQAIHLMPRSALSYQNRGTSKRATGDLDGALADIDEAIRIDPSLASPYIDRATLWRAKRDYDRAITDATEAIGRAKAGPPKNIMTPPNSVLISAYAERGLAYEAKGDYPHARGDFAAVLPITAVDAVSKANQAMAKVRLSLLTEPAAPALAQRKATAPASAPAAARQDTAPAATQLEAAKPQRRRVALVIGNTGYQHVRALRNPANDADAIAKNLRDLGFVVSEGIDLDRARMQAMTRNFLRDAAGAEIALFYYAGHGIQVGGHNYLVPVDVDLKAGVNPVAVMTDMDTIMAGLDDQIRTNILILDACRNNPIGDQIADAGASRSLSTAPGLAAPSALANGATLGAGTLIAFATAPGQVALDGAGANSPFSAALSRHIGTPGLEIQQMLTRVRAEVVAATKSKQVPWSNSSLLGEVYLAAQP